MFEQTLIEEKQLKEGKNKEGERLTFDEAIQNYIIQYYKNNINFIKP